MSNELRATAGVIRSLSLRHPLEHTADSQYCCDVVAVANAYLAEHPADDDEPVTEEWCNSAVGGDSTWVIYCGGEPVIHVFVPGRETGCWCSPKARGDVRRLFAAIGVKLKESKP